MTVQVLVVVNTHSIISITRSWRILWTKTFPRFFYPKKSFLPWLIYLRIMAFFQTPALLRARGGQHQPGPTMPPFHFHVYSAFPTSDPSLFPIHKVFQFEYLGLILDPKLTMHLATVDAIRRAAQWQALALAVSYLLQYDRNSSQRLTPTQNLGLWKAIVLPHLFQNLWYIQSETDVQKCKLISTCPWLYCMYMTTTLHFWQIQESPLSN